MCGWLCASMSGLTRSATRATRAAASTASAVEPIELAGRFDVDRHAGRARPRARARSALLPTPVNTIWSGRKPQRSATSTSPIELASARLPSALQQAHDGQRRIGLERVVDRVRVAAERGVERAVGGADGAGAVDVARACRRGAAMSLERRRRRRDAAGAVEAVEAGTLDAIGDRVAAQAAAGSTPRLRGIILSRGLPTRRSAAIMSDPSPVSHRRHRCADPALPGRRSGRRGSRSSASTGARCSTSPTSSPASTTRPRT